MTGPICRRLDSQASPTQMLRLFRDRPGLVGLLGTWNNDSPVIAFDPVRELGAEEDPFEVLPGTPTAAPAPEVGAETSTARSAVFAGGWIGVWGYALSAALEKLPDPPHSPHRIAAARLAYYDSVLRFDGETWWYEAVPAAGREALAEQRYADIARVVARGAGETRAYECGAFRSVPSADTHREAVARAVRHIEAGDIFQANICLQLEASFTGDPLDLFCAGAEALQPAYAAFLRTADGAVASLSPELFLRRTDRSVLTSPIKGTAPLDSDVAALAASAKDRAENVMIVDLMRNDLGRVCRPGSIKVAAQARPRRHTGVWHLVSDVTGELRDDIDDADLLRATFPPGSVTGAPKVRAMELINTLESSPRHAYTGAIGYVSDHAGLELNVAIRTFEFAGDRVWLGAGGGIVADSDPGAELGECYVKADPLLDAVGVRLAPGTRPDSAGPARPRAQQNQPATAPAAAPEHRPDPDRGIFETLLVLHGRIVEQAGHVDRLAASAKTLYGRNLDLSGLRHRMSRAAGSLAGTHRMRLVVLPGGEDVQIETEPLDRIPNTPWHLAPAAIPGGLGAHKWRDRDLLAAIQPAPGPGGTDTDPLLLETDCSVLETGRGNVFAVFDDGVHTPLADERILPGVTRDRVIQILRAAGIGVFERRIDLSELDSAAEVFVTNSLGGVRPVRSCDGVGEWPAGPTTRWLADTLTGMWQRAEPGRTRRPVSASPSPATSVSASPPSASVLLIDNYDSFVYNLAQYVQELGVKATVVRNDEVTVDQAATACEAGEYSHLIVSPGPGTPADAGISNQLIVRVDARTPVLGVCLGHQCIGQAYGAAVVRAQRVVHGKPSLVHHDSQGVFAGLDGPLSCARYHSLIVRDVPDELHVSARTADGVVMGLRHRTRPTEGVQMHPESILTPHGHSLIANFLRFGRWR